MKEAKGVAAEAVEGHRDLAPVVLEPQLEERVELEVGEAQMKKGKEEGPPEMQEKGGLLGIIFRL